MKSRFSPIFQPILLVEELYSPASRYALHGWVISKICRSKMFLAFGTQDQKFNKHLGILRVTPESVPQLSNRLSHAEMHEERRDHLLL